MRLFEQAKRKKKVRPKNGQIHFLFQMQNRLRKSRKIRTNEKSQKTQKQAQKSRVEESAFNRQNALKFQMGAYKNQIMDGTNIRKQMRYILKCK